MSRLALAVSLCLVASLAAVSFETARSTAAAPAVSYAERMGTRYTLASTDMNPAPRVVEIPLPNSLSAEAIWGATGRDASGHIWIGVSERGNGGSAHLFEYAPDSATLTDRGDVISELKYAGLYRSGEGQIKIHTKIIQADDGYLYFASFDEEGESANPAIAPKWGAMFGVFSRRHGIGNISSPSPRVWWQSPETETGSTCWDIGITSFISTTPRNGHREASPWALCAAMFHETSSRTRAGMFICQERANGSPAKYRRSPANCSRRNWSNSTPI
jgi:hypothetical protein